MSPSFSTSSAVTPVSSRTSRAAASATLSPGSGWPLGRARTFFPSGDLRWGTITTTSSSRTTTPPAENSRSVRCLATGGLEDVALQRVRVVDGDLAPALAHHPGALEHGEEAAGRLA